MNLFEQAICFTNITNSEFPPSPPRTDQDHLQHPHHHLHDQQDSVDPPPVPHVLGEGVVGALYGQNRDAYEDDGEDETENTQSDGENVRDFASSFAST